MDAKAERCQRILIINAALHIGGAEKVISSLAKGLRELGHIVTVCSVKRKGAIGEQLEEEGIPVINLANPNSRISLYTVFFRLAALIKEKQIEVIHTHTPAVLWDAMLAKAMTRDLKLIHTFHFGNYPHLPWQSRVMERLALRSANHLVAVGYSQRESVARTYDLDASDIEVVLNGVDRKEARLDPEFWRNLRKKHSVIVGSVSTLIEQKGIDNLVRTAKILRTRMLDFAVIVAGEGPLRPQLEAQVDAEGLADIFYFLGWVDEAAVSLLPALDVFVQPSRWEAMSIVILEAMAAGLPVVATDVGDNKRVIVDKSTGFVVPPSDEREFADKLEILIQDAELRDRMGKEASRVLQESYSEKRMIANYLRLYSGSNESV